MKNVLVFFLLFLALTLNGIALGATSNDSLETQETDQALEKLESEIAAIKQSSSLNNTDTINADKNSISPSNIQKDSTEAQNNMIDTDKINSSDIEMLINEISNDENCSLVVYNITDEKSFVVSVENLSDNKNCRLLISNSTDGKSFNLVVINNNTTEQPLGSNIQPVAVSPTPTNMENNINEATEDSIDYENLTPGSFAPTGMNPATEDSVDYENLTPDSYSVTSINEGTEADIDYENLTLDSLKITNNTGFSSLENSISEIPAPTIIDNESSNLTPSTKFNRGKRLLEQTYEEELLYEDRAEPIFLAATLSLGSVITTNVNLDVGYKKLFLSLGYSFSNNTQYSFSEDRVELVEKRLGVGVHIYTPEQQVRGYASVGIANKDFNSNLGTGVLTTGDDGEDTLIPTYESKSYSISVPYIQGGVSYKFFDAQLMLYNKDTEDVTALNNPYANIRLGVTVFGYPFQ